MHSMIYFNPLRNEADFSFLKNKKENNLKEKSNKNLNKKIKDKIKNPAVLFSCRTVGIFYVQAARFLARRRPRKYKI